MKRWFFILSVMGILAFPSFGLPKKDKTTAQPAERPAPIRNGLLGVQHQKDDWFFILPDSLLSRPILVTTRYAATPVSAGVYGGELANSQVLTWERKGDRLILRAQMYDAMADSTQTIWHAVVASDESPIIASLKIEQNDGQTHTYRVKVTDLFKGDNAGLSLSPSAKSRFNLGAFKPELSYIDTIKTFPINMEVSSVKTFQAKPSAVPAANETGLMTFRLNTSFVLLPRTPMRGRTFDPRVGYFVDTFTEYTDRQQSAKRKAFITRWRLEPRAEDIGKIRKGELVEPKKPIVFYIDPATPKQWRKYLILGVEDWQKAFEQAGFKKAIIAKEWPENDSTMSLEDARFSVIRYLASPIANAYGPNVHDPRSGEIIESHIGWYHNVMQLLHDWYMVQAGAIDPRAGKPEFDEELMGQLIRFVSSHEVGHTLGLRHNMGASSATPVEKLRDKAWVATHGHTASIMDYARFNYVAQPEDSVSIDGIFPRINDYDKWAIQWGYSYFPDARSEEEERRRLNELTVKTITGNRRLWFGGEGGDNDPFALTEDLGDDVMKSADYGLKNLRRVMQFLPEWTHEEGNTGENLLRGYNAVVAQYRRYIGHVCRQIGGVHHDYKSDEQPGAVFTTISRQHQQRALAWLEANIFTCPTWMIDRPYISRLSATPQMLIRPLAEAAVAYIVSPITFDRITQNATDVNGKQIYAPTTYVDDLLRIFFRGASGTARSDTWHRFVQQQMVAQLIKGWKSSPESEGHAYMTALLTKMKLRLAAVHPADAAMRAHYADLSRQIRMTLDGK